MVSISTPSMGTIIAFGVSVLIIGIGVAYAPEIKSAINRARGAVTK